MRETTAIPNLPLRYLDNPWRIRLLCPTCDGDYVHIQHVLVRQNSDIVTVTNDGPVRSVGLAGVDGRGSTVTVAFWCEEGHGFSLTFHFHKGNTYVWTGDHAVYSEGESLPELWRD